MTAKSYASAPNLRARPTATRLEPPDRSAPNKWRGKMAKIEVKNQSSLGMFWFAGWLFTLGYLNLGFWRGILGLFVWPYFLGSSLTGE